MKKGIIIALVLIIIGAAVCLLSASSMRFDLRKLDSGKYETNTYAVAESFRGISIRADEENISFRPSADGICSVVCLEEENTRHEVAVSEGILTITCVDARKTAGRFGFFLRTPEMTVYLPEKDYADLFVETGTGDIDIPEDFSFDSIAVKGSTSDVSCAASARNGLEIAVSTGDISLQELNAGSIDLKVSTGKIIMENVACSGDAHLVVTTGKALLRNMSCRSLASEGTTGDITLGHVTASDTISITRGTGDVTFDASDAASITVHTTTGDVTGTLLSEKVFFAETDTGKVDVPRTITGGRCEISTDTGNIRIKVG